MGDRVYNITLKLGALFGMVVVASLVMIAWEFSMHAMAPAIAAGCFGALIGAFLGALLGSALALLIDGPGWRHSDSVTNNDGYKHDL